MRNDIQLNGWEIICESTTWNEDFHESVFFVGNGRIGIRGYLPHCTTERPFCSGVYIAGIFDELKSGITDIVHLPTPVFEEAFVDNTPLCLQGNVTRHLNLKTGLFSAEYMLCSKITALYAVHERFASLHNTGFVLQKTTLTAKSDISFEWRTGISLSSRNNPVPDDQTKSNVESLCLFEESAPAFKKDYFDIMLKTPVTNLDILYRCKVCCTHPHETFYTPQQCVGFSYHFTLVAGETICIEKLCGINTSRDISPMDIGGICLGYDSFIADHKNEWASRWNTVQLPKMSDNEIQTAARYGAAQLIMNGNAKDNTVSIGARGLTHPRYKGCYFWDTDFFLLPFYVHTHPQTARNLIQYRLINLPAAKLHAQKTSAKGARYPWMASLDGSEQCESWDIGFSEVHITADVVFSIDNYIKQSGDMSLYPQATIVYIETARFWLDRCTRDAEGKANLLFVKGPDEYCGITNNNLFTNMLVKHNLKLACEAAEYLEQHAPSVYHELALSRLESDSWAMLADDLPIARNPSTGHLQQDDTFHLLEPIDPGLIKNNDMASYHFISFDRVQRYKVIKQADVLLLMTRLPELFTADERRQAWMDYMPICLHDSTLSFASHALFAAQNENVESALFYLRKALLLDLRDIMGNTGKEGLHLANLGEGWQALITLCKSAAYKDGMC